MQARDYLAEHNLEMVIKDAMQAVLRAKPANPREFICQKIKEGEGMYRNGQGRAQIVPELEPVATNGAVGDLHEAATAKLEVCLSDSSQLMLPKGFYKSATDTEGERIEGNEVRSEGNEVGKGDNGDGNTANDEGNGGKKDGNEDNEEGNGRNEVGNEVNGETSEDFREDEGNRECADFDRFGQ